MILRTKRTADIEKAVRAAIPQKAADRFRRFPVPASVTGRIPVRLYTDPETGDSAVPVRIAQQ